MLEIIKKPCNNFRVGRSSGVISFKPAIIVLHIMAGTLAGTDDWFLKSSGDKAVSANYGIGFINGKLELHQYVKDEDTAWAQGRVQNPTFSLYKPNVSPNLYCLSIEHEGQDLSTAPEGIIGASVELVKFLAAKWNIPIDRDHIIGHYQIFAGKPNCPATNKAIIDTIVRRAQEQAIPPMTDKEKIAKAIAILQS
jgi:hypothetical protein